MSVTLYRPAAAVKRLQILLCVYAVLASGGVAVAAGTAVGTQIDNVATVNYDLGGTDYTTVSNTVTITVAERIDVDVTLASAQVPVAANSTNQALLFTVTNTGNGSETFSLAMDSVLAGDDFDPLPAVPSIYFDTDSSGDFNVGDIAYSPGNNDPQLGADESIDLLVVNDIPGTVANGQLGRSQLSASSLTGTGSPGDVLAGQGDGATDAVIGTSGGSDADLGEYLLQDVAIDVQKSQLISDPSGGSEPVTGATLTYTIAVEVTSVGTATASTIRDAIPTYSTFVPGSITLNGTAISDATDGDPGEYDTTGAPAVVVRLGDLSQADGVQTLVFQVTID